MTRDTITVLHSLGPRLTKVFRADGTVVPYDRAKNFSHTVASVSDLRQLHQLIERLSRAPDSCVVRGTPLALGTVERKLENFTDAPHHWLALDVDTYACDPNTPPQERAAAFIRECLPPEFDGQSYVLQLSSSYGTPGKEHLFKARLWFWLANPMDSDQARAWCRWYVGDGNTPKVDPALFNPVQVHYTSAPVFEPGAFDPLAGGPRVTFVEGWDGDVVPNVLPPADWVRTRDATASELLDPRTKGGVVGAFCRAVGSMQDAIERYLDAHLEQVTDTRFTWVGGNTPEGVWLHPSGQHLVVMNGTWAWGSSPLNAFDAVRLFLFGELDPPPSPSDKLTELPSYRAMLELIRTDAKTWPELAAEMAELALPVGPDADEAFGGLDDQDEEETVSVPAAPGQPTRSELIQQAKDKLAAASGSLQVEQLCLQLGSRGPWAATEMALLVTAAKDRLTALGVPMTKAEVTRLFKQPPAPPTGGGSGPSGSGAGGYPHMTATVPARPKNTIPNIRVLLASRGLRLVYDEISKEQYLQNADGRRMALGELSSLANEDDFTPTWAASTALGWLRSMPLDDWVSINPALDWVQSAPWDGAPRIQKLAETLVLEDPTPEAVARRDLYVRKWCLQAVAMLLSTGTTQARGVLTIVGKQNLGKTRWVKSLAPDWTGAGNAEMLHNKDGLIAATKMWICELAEIEGNTRKADVTALKAFLTQMSDEFRRPYAAEAEKHVRRTVFVGSANSVELLADQTGNSRFWAIEIRAMDYEHGIDMQQVFAEALAALDAGENHWFAAEETTIVDEGNVDFEMPDPMLDLIETRLDWAAPQETWLLTPPSILCGQLINRSPPSRPEASAFGIAFRKAVAVRGLPSRLMTRRTWQGRRLFHPPILGRGFD